MNVYNYLFKGSTDEEDGSNSLSGNGSLNQQAIDETACQDAASRSSSSRQQQSHDHRDPDARFATEQTTLLLDNDSTSGGYKNKDYHQQSSSPLLFSSTAKEPAIPSSSLLSAQDFFFSPSNPTIQRYYRFTVTPLQPMAALHKRPDLQAPVTGILRRSAVVPSHGTDAATGKWILVSVGGRSGWARKQVEDENQQQQYQQEQAPLQPAGFTFARTFRAKEAWMGNHAFLLGGKIMLGSDAPSLFFTNGLLLVSFGIYFGLLMPRLGNDLVQHAATGDPSFIFLWHTSWIMWTSLILAMLSMITLWMAAVTDPGILPAHSSPHKPSLSPDAVVGGPFGYRYCSTCNIYRPPRSKHCNSCNVCVDCMDHHCPWIGNCVAIRNYRFFFLFLVCIAGVTILATLVAVQLVLLTYRDILMREALPGLGPQLIEPLPPPPPSLGNSPHVRGGRRHNGHSHTLNEFASYGQHTSHIIWHTLIHEPVIVLFGIFTFLCAWSLISLLAYHALIISVAQTTNERVRGVYRYASVVNTANRGICRNWWNALFSARPPSRLPVDFSEMVVCSECTPEHEWLGEVQITMAPDTRMSNADLDAHDEQ